MPKNIVFILILLIFSSCLTQANSQTHYAFADFISEAPKNTKEIIAWESKITKEGDTITSKSESWQYDINTNLIYWEKPSQYCYIIKKYNEKNRVTYLEKGCGESSDNGSIYVSYPKENTISEKHAMSGYAEFIKIKNSYNQKRKLMRKEIYDSLYDQNFNPSNKKYEIYHYVTVYKYDENNNLIEENTFDLPKLTTAQTISYTYNRYNQITEKQIDTKRNDESFDISIIKYSYYGYLHRGEIKPKLFIVNTTTISDYSTESYIEEYIYPRKNIIEVEQTQINTYINKTVKETYQLIYKDNRLIRKKYFSTSQKKKDRKITSWIDYQYIFY
ncbi:hypothetical protein WAF17_03065 [Bernardetia sp. ABR2-2B]|uniref:hypothetical protein n=1 Tax=Bernardetia sp. ABR2-2B TaxID=3127472 RepID=UPI0030CA981E